MAHYLVRTDPDPDHTDQLAAYSPHGASINTNTAEISLLLHIGVNENFALGTIDICYSWIRLACTSTHVEPFIIQCPWTKYASLSDWSGSTFTSWREVAPKGSPVQGYGDVEPTQLAIINTYSTTRDRGIGTITKTATKFVPGFTYRR